MTGRRQFLKDTGAFGIGIAAGAALPVRANGGSADLVRVAAAEAPSVAGAHAALLPAATLLSIRHAGRSDTLGIKFDDGVFDVAQASGLLAMPAPLTLEQLLRDGSWSQPWCPSRRSHTAACSPTRARSCASG
jgi:hypothetical protein